MHNRSEPSYTGCTSSHPKRKLLLAMSVFIGKTINWQSLMQILRFFYKTDNQKLNLFIHHKTFSISIS